MRFYIDKDELYPYYALYTPENRDWRKPSDFTDIPDELYERYRKAQIEFFAVQDILKTLRNNP